MVNKIQEITANIISDHLDTISVIKNFEEF